MKAVYMIGVRFITGVFGDWIGIISGGFADWGVFLSGCLQLLFIYLAEFGRRGGCSSSPCPSWGAALWPDSL